MPDASHKRGPPAECKTSFKSDVQGGIDGTVGGVGACISEDCVYNESLDCVADEIDVTLHGGHADCATFETT